MRAQDPERVSVSAVNDALDFFPEAIPNRRDLGRCFPWFVHPHSDRRQLVALPSYRRGSAQPNLRGDVLFAPSSLWRDFAWLFDVIDYSPGIRRPQMLKDAL